jgi:hypothetical protein
LVTAVVYLKYFDWEYIVSRSRKIRNIVAAFHLPRPDTRFDEWLCLVFAHFEGASTPGVVNGLFVHTLDRNFEEQSHIWLYIVVMETEYLVGLYQDDVELHLGATLKCAEGIDQNLSFKILMPITDAYNLFSNIVYANCEYAIHPNRSGNWFKLKTLYRTMSNFNCTLIGINWFRFNIKYNRGKACQL